MGLFDFNRVVKLRTLLQLSETQFAKRIGMAQATYHRFEKGTASLNADAIGEIIRIFNVDPFWLLFGEGGSEPIFSTTKEMSNHITISKDEFIELQRKALRQEDRIRELEQIVAEKK
ncbi:hypothetical protein DYBT9623_01253 [Dyadobacter sp. CECT 9623]|uniref:HTH cro/C1-type domain-containing protein n=1 Tax=Dyadobacter linearis TaxID=2823330 RepID=A0ABM8UM79_9BACT|nr:helix-turn-helix transcriptional regulator [Dyadobacter sp. CECT 9623]CAG5068522.1 hypothetical protein DYBT9623_01253 [Dyadobacter sp. CECT 9623]